MSKAIAVYCGSDSYGRSTEVAVREDGIAFYRQYGWNGFGMGYSKWIQIATPLVYPVSIVRKAEYAGSMEVDVQIPEDMRKNRIEWGFNILNIAPGPYRVRLP